MSYKTTAIVVAGGNGNRMKSRMNKPFLSISNKHIISYCLDIFDTSSLIDDIIVVINANDYDYFIESIQKKEDYKKIKDVIKGGATRQDSVYNGLMACLKCDIVLIHDAVRPFVSEDIIKRGIKDAVYFGASITAVPVINTIKQADEDIFVKNTPDRQTLWEVQTPQTFRAGILKEAYKYAIENEIKCTDDASVIEHFGLKVKITMGHEDNIKITTPKDLMLAELIIREKRDLSSGNML